MLQRFTEQRCSQTAQQKLGKHPSDALQAEISFTIGELASTEFWTEKHLRNMCMSVQFHRERVRKEVCRTQGGPDAQDSGWNYQELNNNNNKNRCNKKKSMSLLSS